jgi:hypothetical protein
MRGIASCDTAGGRAANFRQMRIAASPDLKTCLHAFCSIVPLPVDGAVLGGFCPASRESQRTSASLCELSAAHQATRKPNLISRLQTARRCSSVARCWQIMPDRRRWRRCAKFPRRQDRRSPSAAVTLALVKWFHCTQLPPLPLPLGSGCSFCLVRRRRGAVSRDGLDRQFQRPVVSRGGFWCMIHSSMAARAATMMPMTT